MTNDLWTQDSFEDTVARALLTCFETRIRKNRGAGPQSLNAERMGLIRSRGPYIPGSDRVIVAPGDGVQGRWDVDIKNDFLPQSGCVGLPINNKVAPGEYGGFFRAIYIRKKEVLAPGWHRRSGGQLYEMIYAASQNEYVEGERSFFSVNSSGQVVACELTLSSVKGYRPGVKSESISTPYDDLKKIEATACSALQIITDSRFCWTIEAKEHQCFARLGCMEEQVKSLLYARSLPMTSSGRKRPILHLVEAHKRRMKIGTEINIPSAIRGVQTIEMGGTEFTVRPPRIIIQELSEASRLRMHSTNRKGGQPCE